MNLIKKFDLKNIVSNDLFFGERLFLIGIFFLTIYSYLSHFFIPQTFPSLIGTLRSTRIKTVLPVRSSSSILKRLIKLPITSLHSCLPETVRYPASDSHKPIHYQTIQILLKDAFPKRMFG